MGKRQRVHKLNVREKVMMSSMNKSINYTNIFIFIFIFGEILRTEDVRSRKIITENATPFSKYILINDPNYFTKSFTLKTLKKIRLLISFDLFNSSLLQRIFPIYFEIFLIFLIFSAIFLIFFSILGLFCYS